MYKRNTRKFVPGGTPLELWFPPSLDSHRTALIVVSFLGLGANYRIALAVTLYFVVCLALCPQVRELINISKLEDNAILNCS